MYETPFTLLDILLSGRDDYFAFHVIQGTILLPNGYAIHYVQTDASPKTFRPAQASFTATTLAPCEKNPVLEDGMLTGKRIPQFAQDYLPSHPFSKLGNEYKLRHCNLEMIAELANALQELPACIPDNLEIKDVFQINTQAEKRPYDITQFGKHPVDPNSGRIIVLNPDRQITHGQLDYDLS